MVRKLSAPGPRELPAPDIDEADENGFISFESLQQGLTARMPAFSGEPGRLLNIALTAASESVGHRVVIEDPDAEIVVYIPPSDALRFADQTLVEVQALYFGDPIELSPAAQFSTGAEIYAPTVDEAVGNVIPAAVRQATVRIRAFDKMAAGDRIELYMLGPAASTGERIVLEVEPGDVGKDITFAWNTQAYWNTLLHITYEVHQGGRVLRPRASTFTVEGPAAPVRPVYLIEEGEVFPHLVSLTYEGEGRCMPFEVTIPDDARPGDRVTLFAVPSYGKAILDHHVVDGTENGQARMCLSYERVLEWDGIWYVGCLVEMLSGPGTSTSSPATICVFIEGGKARTSVKKAIRSSHSNV